MIVAIGIGLAFIAMLCWGFGDFLIQKSTRKMGDWETLFIITAFGVVVLLPFVWGRLPNLINLSNIDLLIIALACIVLLIAALFDFEALKKGKLSVIEPIWSLEVPVAALLAFLLMSERISFEQVIFIITLLSCLILVGLKDRNINARFFLERGVFVAILGAIFMGGANFLMGWGGRISDPLMINFLSDLFIMIITGIYLLSRGSFKGLLKDLKNNYGVLLPMSILDKVAWVAFVFAMSLAPIAVATALSESYIIIAVLLGLLINKEKLHSHQKIGLIGAIIAAIFLTISST